MNVSVLLENAARVHADSPAVRVGERTVHTYAGLLARASRVAGGLRGALGCRPGDRVAIVMPNRAEYFELLWGCWIAGLCAVPVNAKLHSRELAHILGDSECRVCFVSPETAEAAATAASALEPRPAIVDVASGEFARAAQATPQSCAEVDAAQPAWLFYTSGTTGRPKGATLTHGNLMGATLRYYADVDFVAPGETMLHLAPLSHGSGLYSLPLVAQGAVQVVPDSGGFDADEALDLLERYRSVTTFLAPTMVMRMVNLPRSARAPADHWRTIFYGGAPMHVANLKSALARFGPCFWQGYGQGESPCTITSLSKAMHADAAHPDWERRLASAGTARTGVQVRVVGEDGAPLPDGVPGEVLVRSDVTMAGYWRNPQATRETLRGGWLHTGDVGELAPDGLLTLRDRAKDVIISGGSNIYPRELEEVLLTDPRVAEACVVGRAHADWGEEVVAFVVAAPGEAPSAESLDRLCLDNVARFKRPKAYFFVDALPKSHYGKVLKSVLRERLAQLPAGGGGAPA
ncbi:MAG: AMP-binding protein [Burkholderiaceae bacterium]